MKGFKERLKQNIFQYILMILILVIVFGSLIIVNNNQVEAYDLYQKEQSLVKKFQKNNRNYNLISITLDEERQYNENFSQETNTWNDEWMNGDTPFDYNELSADTLDKLATSDYLSKTVHTAFVPVTVQNMYTVGRDKDEQDKINDMEVSDTEGRVIEKNRFPNALLYASDNEEISREFEIGYREVISGSKPLELDECIISDKYAKLNNLSIGDSIIINQSGKTDPQSHTLIISGIYSSSLETLKDYQDVQYNSINQPKVSYSDAERYNGFDNSIIIHLDTMKTMSIYDTDINSNFSYENSVYKFYPVQETTSFFIDNPKQLHELENDFYQLGLSDYYKLDLVKYNVKSDLTLLPQVKSPISVNIIYAIIGGLITIMFIATFALIMESKILKVKMLHAANRKVLIQQGIIEIIVITILGMCISFIALTITNNKLFNFRSTQISLLFLGIGLFQICFYTLIRTLYILKFKVSSYLVFEKNEEKKNKYNGVAKVVVNNGKVIFLVLSLSSLLFVRTGVLFGDLDSSGVVKKVEVNYDDNHPYTVADDVLRDNLIHIEPDSVVMEELDLLSSWYNGEILPITTEQYLSFIDSQYVENYSYFLYQFVHVDNLTAIKDEGADSYVIPGNWDNTIYASYTSEISDEFDDGTREIIEGDVFKQLNECIVSDEYATLNNLNIGDSFEISNGEDYALRQTLTITGIYKDYISGDAPYWRRYSGDWIIRQQVLDRDNLLYSEEFTRNEKDVRANDIYVSFETIVNLPMFDEVGNNELNAYIGDMNDIDKFRKETSEKGLPEFYKVELEKDIEHVYPY